ncbi:MAG: solute carrier organic anion transporter [Chloroflexi bacterium]|nr:solute carrier organic anion transporter [Chloroflexota bacterium]MBM4452919.1 solute carrier organic anion transporter [Chloroflexota bacterium]MBM4453129.1 solute carrier organic anion transporter [Chloroflexota bacterium]
MQWEFIVALVIAIPLILFPAAFVWYLNVGGLFTAMKEAREKRARAKQLGRTVKAEK